VATISAVDLGGDQLLIRADRPLSFITRPERGGRYRVIIRNAQFASNMQQPRLGLGSAVSRIEYRQDNDQMVSIILTPAQGVRVLNAQIFSSSSVLVQFQRPDAPPSTGSTGLPGSGPTVITPQPQPPFGSTPPPEDLDPSPEGTPRRTNERPVVVIDPGHGGRDPGAIGIGGIRETDIVLDISFEIARTLQQQGIIVRLTRTSEVEIDLAPRVATGERANADAFVSIHANAISMSRPDINGLEVFYSPGRPRSARFAATLHNTIVSTMNMRTRGLKVARFYVIRRNTMPSALIETGFVTGSEDAPNLASPAWRRQMARAIARGILLYLRGGGG
jgi:N-acetylmuramoyl-L-alanine amidase